MGKISNRIALGTSLLAALTIGVVAGQLIPSRNQPSSQTMVESLELNCSAYNPIPVVFDVENSRMKNISPQYPSRFFRIDGPDLKFKRTDLQIRNLEDVERVVATMVDRDGLKWEMLYPLMGTEGKTVGYMTFEQEGHPCYGNQVFD